MRKSGNFGGFAVAGLLGSLLFLAGCNMLTGLVALPESQAPAVRDAAAIEAALDSTDVAVSKATVPSIIGTGYATISVQPARNVNQKRLMAIRVARLNAMRDLTEQVHGMQLNSQTTVINAVLQNDTTRTAVAGTIRGARTVRINPVGKDTYEVVLELDRDMISRIMKAAR